MCKLRRKLERSGFLVSPKYVLEPSSSLDFVGTEFDLEREELSNKQGLLNGPLILCLHLVLGDLSRKGMERLLAGLEWALKPYTGAGALLAGAYRSMKAFL